MKPTLTVEADTSFVTLRGDIAEDFEASLAPLEPKLAGRRVVFDCDGVGRMNSYGARGLALLLLRLRKRFATVEFRSCPQALIEFANMFPLVDPKEVVTFYAPAYCKPCGKSRMLLVETAAAAATGALPATPCPDCRRPLAFEVDEDYLSFLERA